MNVIISQAMASGLPVVATRHSGIPEQVHDGINGFLVPEGDVQALAGAIVRMLECPERWAEFGRTGRELAARNYNAEILISRQIELYRSIIGQD